MKNNKYLLIIIVSLGFNFLSAQVQNNGPLFIGDSGEFYLNSGNYNFGALPGSTTTSRSATNYGKITFSSGATWSGASNNHFVDGYVRTLTNNPFIFPIGQSGVYAPVRVIPNNTTTVDAAYFRSNPGTVIGSNVNGNISALSSLEYWNIKGTNSSFISISWSSSSNINTMSGGNLNRLTIVGWNGSAWNEITSTVDNTTFLGGSSTTTAGSISSTSLVDLTIYSYFTFGIKGIECIPLTASSGITKTWNGSWSPSAPTLADPAVLNSPYSGNLVCNSLVLNADLILANGEVAEIVNDVIGTGRVIMSSEASLIQHNNLAQAPTIELTKRTNPMRRFDYVYLSSPINNPSNYFTNLEDRFKVAANGNYGTQSYAAFDNYLTYNATGTTRVIANATNTPIGIGHSATVRSQPPFATSQTAGSWYNEKYPIHLKISGIANNGIISLSIPPNGWIYVGNPYPSALNGEKLLDAAGNNMRKTIYYWTFNTPRLQWSNNGNNYSNADFATWNYTGGVAACPTCQVPTGEIASMQSVLMRGIVPNASTLEITNCMRGTSNNNFFRSGNNIDDKFRLNLISADESFSQALIAYSEEGTLGYDNGYDGLKMFSSTTPTTSITSLIGTSRYAIQTRPLFQDTDVVPLQIDIATAQSLTISLATKEGVFEDNEVTIFLHDKDLGVFHDLNAGPYTFIQSELANNSRFEIVYRADTLSDPDLNHSTALAFISDNSIKAQSTVNMVEIQIFDLAGRHIVTYQNINNTILTKPFFYAQGVYIAKIKLDNGTLVNQKLINN